MGARSDDDRIFTVARVRASGDDVEVMFFESARIYRVRAEGAELAEIVAKLREAERTGRPVAVRLAAPHGDEVIGVAAP